VALMVVGCASSLKGVPPSRQVESAAQSDLVGDFSETPDISQISLPPSSSTPALAELEEWDLLIISDSSNWGVGQYYAKLIEADLNVKVNLHDCWNGNQKILHVLQTLQSGRTWTSFIGDKSCQKPLTDLIKEAEVMVLFGNPLGADSPVGGGACMAGSYVNKNKLPEFETYKSNLLTSCAPENWATYKTNLGLVIDEIYKLRDGNALILRMTDFYIPVHASYIANDMDDVCTACLSSFADAIRQAAAEHGVPVADTMSGFNGKDYLSDPVEAGYIKFDGIHPSDKGAQYIATLLQQTGYEDAVKP
jgi:lysophospholipase L1-like esterase